MQTDPCSPNSQPKQFKEDLENILDIFCNKIHSELHKTKYGGYQFAIHNSIFLFLFVPDISVLCSNIFFCNRE